MTDEMNDVDPVRQAEIDALAAELQGTAPVKAKRGSRRVVVPDPSAFADAELPAGAPTVELAVEPTAAEAEEADVVRSIEATEFDQVEAPAEDETIETDVPAEGAEDENDDAAESSEAADGEPRSSRSRRGRNRNRNKPAGEGSQPAQGGNGSNGNGGAQAQADDEGGQTRQQQQTRDRKRGRGRTGFADDADIEITEDDVLIPVAGILDVLENYAFVRTTGYLSGPTDVYVSLGQVKRYGLRRGDAVVGSIRQPREGEQPGRQKYNALVRVDSVNGQPAEPIAVRPDFAAGVAIPATEPIPGPDLFRGSRVLLAGGDVSSILQTAAAVNEGLAEAHLMVISLGGRPEDATQLRRAVRGEVVVSGLDQLAEDHVTVTELAVERAKRLVELGIDVVVLVADVNELGRAQLALNPRATADDPTLALPAKRLFASARQIEGGASLTIVATATESTSIDRLVVSELGAIATSRR